MFALPGHEQLKLPSARISSRQHQLRGLQLTANQSPDGAHEHKSAAIFFGDGLGVPERGDAGDEQRVPEFDLAHRRVAVPRAQSGSGAQFLQTVALQAALARTQVQSEGRHSDAAGVQPDARRSFIR